VLKIRKASGVTSDTVLLIILVLVCSLLLYFLLGSLKNNSASDNSSINDTDSILLDPEIIDNPRLEEAVSELRQSGCELLIIEPKVYLDDPNNVTFTEFKSKAMETRLVVVTPSEYGTILLVQIKKEQWIWCPS
jgi:hypothetical protein